VKQLLETSNLAAPATQVGNFDVALTDATEGFLRTAESALDLNIGDVQPRAVQSDD